MTEACLEALVETLPPFDVTNEAIECHHNYASRERHAGADVFVTRKGAISARAGELGIVPGSMGAHSYIVRGRGNARDRRARLAWRHTPESTRASGRHLIARHLTSFLITLESKLHLG